MGRIRPRDGTRALVPREGCGNGRCAAVDAREAVGSVPACWIQP